MKRFADHSGVQIGPSLKVPEHRCTCSFSARKNPEVIGSFYVRCIREKDHPGGCDYRFTDGSSVVGAYRMSGGIRGALVFTRIKA